MNFPGWEQHEGVISIFSCGLSCTTLSCLYLVAAMPGHKKWGQTFPLHFKYSSFHSFVAKKRKEKNPENWCEFQFLLRGKLWTVWHLYAWLEMSEWQNVAHQFGNLTRWFMKVHHSVSHTGGRRFGRGLPGGSESSTKTDLSWYKDALLVNDTEAITGGPHSPDKEPVTFTKMETKNQWIEILIGGRILETS